MATVANREAYFETGLEVLADVGYGGLKLAEVCNRLGVTTGSFYHYFASGRPSPATWSPTGAGPDRPADRRHPRGFRPAQPHRGDHPVGLSLPHRAEAAIRSWSSVDPHVLAVQSEVDRARYKILYDSAIEIVDDVRPGRGVRLLGGLRLHRL